MRIRAINAVSGIHGKERVQMVQDFQSHQERMKGLQELPPPKHPLADNIYISPTEASRVLEQSAFSKEFLQAQASSTSITATSKDVNLLAQADAISQEMLSDLKSSMSLSGENLEDITLPERRISIASSRLDELNDTIPPAPPEPRLYQPEPPVASQAQRTRALTQPLPSEPVPTNNEEPVIDTPADQIFSPNRKNALPPVKLPADISYVNDPQELTILDKQQENQKRLEIRHQENETQFRHPEEDIEKAHIPTISLHQPLKPLGDQNTGLLAVEEPEKLMSPDQRNPIQDLKQSINAEMVVSLASTLL